MYCTSIVDVQLVQLLAFGILEGSHRKATCRALGTRILPSWQSRDVNSGCALLDGEALAALAAKCADGKAACQACPGLLAF